MSKKGELQKDYQYLVGMTVVDKLGDLSGRQVVRINASDQVVLKDTSFGSNFPVSRFSYIPKSRKEKQYDAIEATSVDYADEFDTNQPPAQDGVLGALDEPEQDRDIRDAVEKSSRIVQSWPEGQRREHTSKEPVAVEPATDEPMGTFENPYRVDDDGTIVVPPATDEQIADCWESFSEYPNEWAGWIADAEAPRLIPALIARVRQEQLFSSRMKYERDVAVHRRERAEAERDEAVARAKRDGRDLSTMTNAYGQAIERAEKAEEGLDAAKEALALAQSGWRPLSQRENERLRAEVALMRPVVLAALDASEALECDMEEQWERIVTSVSAYRAARKEGQ